MKDCRKRHILRYIALALALSIGLGECCFCAEETENIAEIISFNGDVKVYQADKNAWVDAREDMRLNNKDKIKTAASAGAEISLDSTLKNIATIGPETEIEIEDCKANKLFMSKGKIMAVLESLPAESSFEVRTPTAVAGVAGTVLSVETDGEETGVSCIEGDVYVSGLEADGTLMERVLLRRRCRRMIRRGSRPGIIVPLTEAEIRDAENARKTLCMIAAKRRARRIARRTARRQWLFGR